MSVQEHQERPPYSLRAPLSSRSSLQSLRQGDGELEVANDLDDKR